MHHSQRPDGIFLSPPCHYRFRPHTLWLNRRSGPRTSTKQGLPDLHGRTATSCGGWLFVYMGEVLVSFEERKERAFARFWTPWSPDSRPPAKRWLATWCGPTSTKRGGPERTRRSAIGRDGRRRWQGSRAPRSCACERIANPNFTIHFAIPSPSGRPRFGPARRTQPIQAHGERPGPAGSCGPLAGRPGQRG